MKYYIFILIVYLMLVQIPTSSFGQSYYSENATSRVYTNIHQALQERHLVFRLDLSDQELTTIPKEIFLLENLEYLVLDRNKIGSPKFPPNKLNQLKYLSLNQNGIREFVVHHDCLNQLKELYLDQNELIEYPEINNSFIELITLSVRGNYITTLPEEDLTLSRARFL